MPGMRRLECSGPIMAPSTATNATKLRNGALNHRRVQVPTTGTTTFTLAGLALHGLIGLIGLIVGTLYLAVALDEGNVKVEGDVSDLGNLIDLMAPVDPVLAITTP